LEARKKHEETLKKTKEDLAKATATGENLKESFESKEEKLLKADADFENKRMEVDAAKSGGAEDDWAWAL